MEPRTEEKKDRFRFDKLEARIAPGGHACFGLLNAFEHAGNATQAPPEVVEHVLETIVTHNPHAAGSCGL